jgi:hypothetical protein
MLGAMCWTEKGNCLSDERWLWATVLGLKSPRDSDVLLDLNTPHPKDIAIR